MWGWTLSSIWEPYPWGEEGISVMKSCTWKVKYRKERSYLICLKPSFWIHPLWKKVSWSVVSPVLCCGIDVHKYPGDVWPSTMLSAGGVADHAREYWELEPCYCAPNFSVEGGGEEMFCFVSVFYVSTFLLQLSWQSSLKSIPWERAYRKLEILAAWERKLPHEHWALHHMLFYVSLWTLVSVTKPLRSLQ